MTPDLEALEKIAERLEKFIASMDEAGWKDDRRLEIVDAVDGGWDFEAGDFRALPSLIARVKEAEAERDEARQNAEVWRKLPNAWKAEAARLERELSALKDRASSAGQYAEQITDLTGRLASVEGERDRLREALEKSAVRGDGGRCELCGKWTRKHGHAPDCLLSTPAPAGGGWRPTHRHVKRGTTYRVVSDADVQANEPIAEGTPVVVYQGHDGRYWVRPSAEFHDGRFEPLSPTEKED